MRVDRDEALERLRDAADLRALQPREGDDAVGGDDPVRDEKQLAGSRLGGICASVDLDPALVEEGLHRLARVAPEQVQRLVLGRDESHASRRRFRGRGAMSPS